MYGLLIGTFITLKIENLLVLYFNNVSFYYDIIIFSNKNLIYINIMQAALGWFSYEKMFTNNFLVLQTFKLVFSYEFFPKNFKLTSNNIYWQYVVKIFVTHGKRFMLFKNYRNDILINVLKIFTINFVVILFVLLIEVTVFLISLYCLFYLIKVEFNKRLTSKFTEYTNYLKGLSYSILSQKKIKYTSQNYIFLVFFCIFIFKYLNIYYFFDLYIFIFLLYFIGINLFYCYYIFFIFYNFYFSFVSIFTFNKFFKKLRLIIKTLIIKSNLYVTLIILQLIYLINSEIYFELIINNNFYQELLIKFFIVYNVLSHYLSFFNY